MSRLTLFALLLLFATTSFANDGAFYASGNQLIPMVETDISVKKEILTIKRKNDRQVDVIVYYEFYNPKEAKSLTVGFEAASPSGDVDVTPKNGQHPNISNFTVEMNNTIIPYKVSIVGDSLYYKDGTIKSLTEAEIEQGNGGNYADFNYVYHFTADFKQGVNTVKHTYTCDLSGGVMYHYYFDYILSAAMRWGNRQIDDFTLIIDMGDFQDIYIEDAAFGKSPTWILTGIAKTMQNQYNHLAWYDAESESSQPLYTRFFLMNGQIVYKQMNYRTKDELVMFSPRDYIPDPFDYKESALPFYIDNDYLEYLSAANEVSKKVLRNLPFARRGYIFYIPELQNYYSSQIWYTPNPNYKSSFDSLTKEEKVWVNHWSK